MLEEDTHLVLGLVAGRVGVEVELHAFRQRLHRENAARISDERERMNIVHIRDARVSR